jgi:anion transporter
MDKRQLLGAIIVVSTILLWATALLPEYVTALLFLLSAEILRIAPTDVIFSGFQTPALWLVFSGLILGLAIRRTGLGARLSSSFISTVPGSYPGIVISLVLAGVVLSFFMPSSMGRVVLVVPVAVFIADELNLAQASKSRSVLILIAALGAYLPSAGILPANIPNLILANEAEALYGIHLSYTEYFVDTFVTIGLGKVILLIAIGISWSSAPVSSRLSTQALKPMEKDEKKLVLILLGAMLLWATDAIHGINPGWVGMAAAVFCLIPRWGMLDEKSFNHDVSWTPLFHAGAIIGLGAVLAVSGLGDTLGRSLVEIAPFSEGKPFLNFMILVALMTAICVVTTTPGAPAVLTPLASKLAEASGLPISVVLLSEVLAFSVIVFPYQGAPLVFACAAGKIRPDITLKVLAMTTAGSFFVIAPLTFIWWRALGLLP